MGDVGIARLAFLVSMLFCRDVICPLQQCEVGLRVQLPMHSGERFKHLLDRAGALGGDSPREPGPHPPGRRRRPLRTRGCGGVSRRCIDTLQVLAHSARSRHVVTTVPLQVRP
jgi:hypothetical protein